MLLNDPYFSIERLASYIAAINFIMEVVFFLAVLFLVLASFSVMANIGCNSMRSEICDFVAVVVCSLRV